MIDVKDYFDRITPQNSKRRVMSEQKVVQTSKRIKCLQRSLWVIAAKHWFVIYIFALLAVHTKTNILLQIKTATI